MDYSLFGQTPTAVLAPSTVDALAAALRAASAERAAVVPWGAGTRQHIGVAPARYTLALSIAALDQIVEYNPADLVVTVQAGATLGTLQARLAEHGQRLPWDPPTPPEATIGGLLATNASGPLRLGYGPPRDWTLGMQVVLGDGRPVRSGGKVVKNVAGYDAHKLHIGALGTLGVITEVTFKLAPLPQSQHTLVASCTDRHTAFAVADALRAAPLEPVSAIVGVNLSGAGSITVLARFAGTPAAVDRLLALAAERSAQRGAQVSERYPVESERAVWGDAARLSAGGGVLLRAGVRPSLLPQLTEALEQPAIARGWPVSLALYPGVGVGYARWEPGEDGPGLREALAAARAALSPIGGYVVVEDAPVALRPPLDIWGPPSNLPLMRALKAQWDPHGALNPGRYVGDL